MSMNLSLLNRQTRNTLLSLKHRLNHSSYFSPSLPKALGFTLIEVMVSLAILALAMVPLLVEKNRSFKTSLQNHYYRQALFLGYEKMLEIQRGETEESSGEFEGFSGYSWKVTEEEVPLSQEGVEMVLKKWTLEIEYPYSEKGGKIILVGYGPGS